MGIRQAFGKVAKKIGAGLCILSLAFMAACGYPSHQLGTSPGLQGATAAEVMFEGAEAQNHLTIDATALQPKNHYRYEGSVTIRGSVPENTEITVTNGRLEVTGNVGSGSGIAVTMP